jgi:MFS family permease
MDEQPKVAETATGFYTRLESLAKAASAFLVLFYGMGFLILALHDAQFGIVQFSALRPRIFVVGFVFAVLVAFAVSPLLSASVYPEGVRQIASETNPKLQRPKTLFLVAGFPFTAFFMSVFFNFFLFIPDTTHHGIPAIAALVFGIVTFAIVVPWLATKFSLHPNLTAYGALALSAVFMCLVYWGGNQRVANLTLWLAIAHSTFMKAKESKESGELVWYATNWFQLAAFFLSFCSTSHKSIAQSSPSLAEERLCQW